MISNKRINLSNKERYYILSRDNFTCQYCGRKAPDVELHVDHLIPVARGGSNSDTNLLSSCSDCNLSKQASLLPDHIIIEKQEDILTRTIEYQKHIHNNPLPQIETSTDSVKRPIKLLKEISNIAEPLKNRSLNKDKRHALNIYIEDVFTIKLSYGRLDSSGWVIEPVSNEEGIMRALRYEDYLTLIKSTNLTKLDCIEEDSHKVHTYRDKINGVYLLIVTDDDGSVPYAFFSPTKELVVNISIESETLDYLSDDEMEFYSL